MEASAEKKKELVLFEGSLKDYAEMLLKDKRGDGSVINLGKIHEAIIKELSKRDIQLVDTRIIVDQHTVTKYFAHPKGRKGTVLPMEEYGLIGECGEKATKDLRRCLTWRLGLCLFLSISRRETAQTCNSTELSQKR